MISRSKNIFFLIFLVLFEAAVYLSNDMILPALPTVVKDFGKGESFIPASLGIFLFGSIAIQLIIGPLSDRYGRRPTMFAGGAVVLLGNAIGMFCPDMLSFFAGRIFQGMGTCFVGVAGYACVHELYKEKEAVHVISMMSSVALLAPLIGPFLGSLILINYEWRYIFATTFVLSGLGIFGLWLSMPETLSTQNKIKFNLTKTIDDYKKILQNKEFLLGTLAWGTTFGALMIWISSSPLILMNLMGLNSTEFSIAQIPIFVGFICGTFVLRALNRVFNLYQCVRVGISFCFIGFLLLIVMSIYFERSIVLLIGSITLFDFGYGILSAPLTRLILDSSNFPKGITSSLFYFIGLSIGSLASVLFGTVYNYKLSSFTISLTAIMLVSFVFLHLMKRARTAVN